MDIFNRKKVLNLQQEINEAYAELELCKEELRKYRDDDNISKHITGAWCEGCKNSKTYTAMGCYPTKFCMLDNPCKDRIE